MSSNTESKLVKVAKEAVVLVGLSAGIGYLVKKAVKKTVTGDPSLSLMNATEWTGVLMGAIYARDYLVEQKIVPAGA